MASVALGYGIGRKSEGRRLKRVTDLDIDSAAQPVSLKSQVGVQRRRVFRHICTHAQRRVKERELQMWHFGDAIGCGLLDHTGLPVAHLFTASKEARLRPIRLGLHPEAA